MKLGMLSTCGSAGSIRPAHFLLPAIGLSLLLAGCNSTVTSTADKPTVETITSVASEDGFQLELVCPVELSLSGQAKLKVTVTRGSQYDVKAPSNKVLAEKFLVRDSRTELPRIDGDNVIVTHVYTIEPKQAGTVTVDPLPFEFTNTRDAGATPRVVSTKPLDIEVTTLVGPDDRRSLSDLEDADAPLELPPDPMQYVVWAVAGFGILAAVLLAVLLKSRKSKPVERQLTPTEIAHRDLAELRSSGIAERDSKEFYVQLTGIVRRYVEGTTKVRAPEQTTDEFLREIEQRQLFSSDDQSKFREFLESADLVKYAAHTPTTDDIANSLTRAEAFVSGPAPSVEADGGETA